MNDEATVYVVDNDPAVRDGLRISIRSVGLNVETYASAQEFLDAFNPEQPGCLVLDVRMPGMSGLELQEFLHDRNINVPIIMISGHGDIPMAVETMKKGAIDFIEKPFRDQVLLERIQKAVIKDQKNRQQQKEQEKIITCLKNLTTRERQVMERVVSGKPNKVIAMDLGIKQKTVEFHRARVMQKMKAESIAELVKMASKVCVP